MNGDIRICLDLKALNESVLRVYPLPKVDETLAQLTGATVFSKLNTDWYIVRKCWSHRVATTFSETRSHYQRTLPNRTFGHNTAIIVINCAA